MISDCIYFIKATLIALVDKHVNFHVSGSVIAKERPPPLSSNNIGCILVAVWLSFIGHSGRSASKGRGRERRSPNGVSASETRGLH